MLPNYTSTDGHEYTASSYWLNAGYCNGFISNSSMNVTDTQIFYTYCGKNLGVARGDYQAVQAKDYALGLLRGAADPKQNNALSTNTSGGNPSTDATSPDSIMFRTNSTTPLTLPVNRFISFSVDAANSYCSNGHEPQMRFEFVQNGQTTTVPNSADPSGLIDPCTSAGNTQTDLRNVSGFSSFPDWAAIVNYGTFYSGSFLTGSSASTADLILRNISDGSSQGKGIGNAPANTQGYVAGKYNGNDGAIDNIQILDTTPKLTKSFSPTVTSIGATSRLTLTVNNRTDNAAKNGWGFVDTLSTGLTIAATPNLGGTCLSNPNSATVVAPAGGQSITVTNGKLGGAASTAPATSCTIEVDVTSSQAAVYANGQDNMSQQVGIDGPTTPATVKFTKGSVQWSKIDSASKQALAGSQWTITRTGANLPAGSSEQGTVGPALNTPFTITDTGSDSTSQVGTADDYTTDADSGAGYLAVQYLPWGTYSLQETQAPAGYKPSTTTYSFTIGAGGLTIADNTVISAPVSLAGDGISGSQVPNAKLEQAVCRADSPNLYTQYSRQEPAGSGKFTNKLQRYDVGSGAVTDLADLSSKVTRETNGLGISADGRYFYLVDFDLKAVSDPHIYRYDAQTGDVSTFNAATNFANGTVAPANDNGKVRRGGVDLNTGVYYYSTTQMQPDGKTATNINNLYAFDPSTGNNWYVGTVTTRDNGQSGDLAFDNQGDMYFVVGNDSTAYVNVYPGKLPSSPSTQPIAINTQFLNQVGSTGNGVGIAYGNGYLYTSNTNGDIYQVDPSTGANSKLTTLPIPAGTGNTSQSGLTVDLATCTPPNTLTVKKNYPNGRDNVDDNVTLSAWRNGSTQVGQNVDTNGPATGVQTNQLGPVPILVGNGSSYTVRETAKGGSNSLTAYDTSYACTDQNDSTWPGVTGTIPSGDTQRDFTLGTISAGGQKARAIVCTFTNKPISGSVTWSKTDEGGHLLRGSEWTLTGPSVPANTVVKDCTSTPCGTQPYTDQDPAPGSFELDSLKFGAYTLTEHTAPAGFVVNTTSHSFTIDATHREIELGVFRNPQAKPPVLPLTGGLSTDAFRLASCQDVRMSAALASAEMSGWR